ncbi:SMODS domain-containing nucleotidyltransferase [Stenotrophomonas maltophilia]|uniref:SMODS domain-containing nucleotidyltransferase n=1 Tax=Stenotrophomonas maltophilia TaxID=40324 RepID=UPI0021C98086|nr:hypothetical protein [Stenotrophomonas maltophilia]MCU1014738.1 hypothetical protein [Stenotrophomonas maltophilia]MDH1129057.1 hypothetical protein [Stenotrophomonas maltophilia]HDS1132011.1 hypothetical protein [Stenotrophomonas maltophilia]HEL7888856.1 hypothetical protein [Stenotrophomonas maltophilia]
MSDASLFCSFMDNLTVSNADDISTKYESITTRLNKDFWNSDSETAHTLQIGSYGRYTAIDGVSDLDMAFSIPKSKYDYYKDLGKEGPKEMLNEVKKSLEKRYDKTKIKVDGQIVGVFYSNYHVEVLPAYEDANGDFWHGDTNTGEFKLTKPRPEIKAFNDLNRVTNGNLKACCRMLRQWKNQVGVGIGGLLIDTLTYNFFIEHINYHNATYKNYPQLLVSLFAHLGGLDMQDYWMAPGSNQRVKCKTKFQSKAKRAATRCQEAIDATNESTKVKLWKKVFGRKFPSATITALAMESLNEPLSLSYDQEQFIEERFGIDVRYTLEVEAELREGTNISDRLRQALRRRECVPLGRHLRFYVAECDVPRPYMIAWKVRNQGQIAISKKMLRGEITFDKDGLEQKYETADFSGEHYVEAYAIKDGVCVARGKIKVPI